MSELPEIRIGTAEREQAMQQLGDHFSAGRLTLTEFDDRTAIVVKATTRGEIASVFTDLPAPVSAPTEAVDLTKKAPSNDGWEWRAALVGITPFIALLLFFAFDQWQFFLLIPVVAIVVYGGRADHNQNRRRQLERRNDRRNNRRDRRNR